MKDNAMAFILSAYVFAVVVKALRRGMQGCLPSDMPFMFFCYHLEQGFPKGALLVDEKLMINYIGCKTKKWGCTIMIKKKIHVKIPVNN